MARLNEQSTFVSFMSHSYRKHQVIFHFIDDYLLWLYEELCNYNEILYYQTLEEDIVKFCEFQERKRSIC
ncbi:MAG: hypothetical protein HFH08_04465 [Bacilli bacterium]|nr:hypothetical protein [Bacilli bacterium]